jgi:hypothetical protein
MTLTLDRVTPWEFLDIDPEEILAELRLRFPGICLWRGDFTGHFFAALLGISRQDQLVEATTPGQLIHVLTTALRPGPVVPHLTPPTRALVPDPGQAQTAPSPSRGRHQAQPQRSLWRRFASQWTTG